METTIATFAAILGLGLAVAAFRRRNLAVGGAVLLVAIAIAVVPAARGEMRPIVAMLAFGFLAAAFGAGERKKDLIALGCFSAGFVTLIIAAMYT